ncbi:hypothetical protein SVIOM74S_03096 [Streptomyces violarus]
MGRGALPRGALAVGGHRAHHGGRRGAPGAPGPAARPGGRRRGRGRVALDPGHHRGVDRGRRAARRGGHRGVDLPDRPAGRRPARAAAGRSRPGGAGDAERPHRTGRPGRRALQGRRRRGRHLQGHPYGHPHGLLGRSAGHHRHVRHVRAGLAARTGGRRRAARVRARPALVPPPLRAALPEAAGGPGRPRAGVDQRSERDRHGPGVPTGGRLPREGHQRVLAGARSRYRGVPVLRPVRRPGEPRRVHRAGPDPPGGVRPAGGRRRQPGRGVRGAAAVPPAVRPAGPHHVHLRRGTEVGREPDPPGRRAGGGRGGPAGG